MAEHGGRTKRFKYVVRITINHRLFTKLYSPVFYCLSVAYKLGKKGHLVISPWRIVSFEMERKRLVGGSVPKYNNS